MSWMRGLGWWRRRKAEATERRMASVYGGGNTFHADGRYLAWGFDRATPDYTTDPGDPDVVELRAHLRDRALLGRCLPEHTKIRHRGGRCYFVELRDGPDLAEPMGLESLDRFIAFPSGSAVHVGEVDMELL